MSSVLKIRKSINEPWIEVPAIVPNLDDYATKDYVDDAIGNIDVSDVDLSDYYTKSEVNGLIPDTTGFATTKYVDDAIGDVDLSNYYNKTEVEALFNSIVDGNEVAY